MTKNTSLKEATVKWLSTQGFLLEMKVAKKFYDNNFEVISSSIYEDPINKISREIDVIVSKGTLFDKHIRLNITFVIECKYSRDKPWVLFKASEQNLFGKNYNIVFRNCSDHAKLLLLELDSFNKELNNNYLFSFNEDLYYGIKRAHIETDHMINGAVTEVCNAVRARELKIDRFNTSLITNLEVLFPIIVVQGSLFETYLDDKLGLVLNEINHGHLFVSKPELGNERMYIDIISFDHLDYYIEKISQAVQEVLNYSDKLKSTKEFIKNKRSRK